MLQNINHKGKYNGQVFSDTFSSVILVNDCLNVWQIFITFQLVQKEVPHFFLFVPRVQNVLGSLG